MHMIQTVVKRDGRIVGFNREKIAAAVRKAMLTTESGEDEALIYKIVDHITVLKNIQYVFIIFIWAAISKIIKYHSSSSFLV